MGVAVGGIKVGVAVGGLGAWPQDVVKSKVSPKTMTIVSHLDLQIIVHLPVYATLEAADARQPQEIQRGTSRYTTAIGYLGAS
jgi:hypothetical protein